MKGANVQHSEMKFNSCAQVRIHVFFWVPRITLENWLEWFGIESLGAMGKVEEKKSEEDTC